MRPGSQEWSTENKENKEKVIDNEEEVRQYFKNFWKTDNSPKFLMREIKQLEEDEYEQLIKHEGEQLAWLMKRQNTAKRKRSKNYNPNELVFISGNEEKRNELSEIVKERDLSLSSHIIEDKNESNTHKIIRELIKEDAEKSDYEKLGYTPYWYSLDVAKSKIDNTFDRFDDNPIIASDVVVLKGDGLEVEDIFEKAENTEEALDILMNFSGEKVNISCGIALMTITKSGKRVLLKGGINFTIQLKRFSSEEAEEYIREQADNILNIAGVIDYSSLAAQKLIDSGVPVKAEALKLDGYNPSTVLISPKILPNLRDYLKGVPSELIEKMLNKQKALSEV